MVLVGCASSTRLVPQGGYVGVLGREHPLTGKIWSLRERAFVAPAVLEAALESAPRLLLGETHDNLDQHKLEAALLEKWLKAHPEARVAFEMLDEDQAQKLVPRPRTAYELAARVAWQESGLPDFELYAPVFATVIDYGAQVVAAHPNREHVHSAMLGELSEQERAPELDRELPAPERSALADEIRESHCGYAPADVLEPMLRAQTYKDAFMAHVIAQAAPSALVAGRGHVRRDRGVPFHLQKEGKTDFLSVALLDVDDARKKAEQYDVAAFDFVIFTPRVSDEDPCARFKKQLEELKKSHLPVGPGSEHDGQE
jgi:uncharacterized iron-regulated protein